MIGVQGLLLACAAATTCMAAPSVLMVLTSHGKLGDTDTKTGWYLPEAAHPYYVFKEAGVKMTWASPEGGETPVDPGSVDAYKKDKEATAFLNDKDTKKLWKNTKKLSDVDPTDFDAVFVVGGYGVMWDLVGNKDLEKIAAKLFDRGAVVSGVCHGPAALVGVKLSDGSSLVKGKKVSCFSNAEEDVVKRRKVVPHTCQDSFKDAGAKYTEAKPWADHVSVAGSLITGQNPQSAKSTAQAVVKALGKVDASEKFEVGMAAVQPENGITTTVLFGVVSCVATIFLTLSLFRRHQRARTVWQEQVENAMYLHEDFAELE